MHVLCRSCDLLRDSLLVRGTYSGAFMRFYVVFMQAAIVRILLSCCDLLGSPLLSECGLLGVFLLCGLSGVSLLVKDTFMA